jgi:hypothetical protein
MNFTPPTKFLMLGMQQHTRQGNGSWSNNTLNIAIEAVDNGEKIATAARLVGILVTSLTSFIWESERPKAGTTRSAFRS